jgi:hypothetical protein
MDAKGSGSELGYYKVSMKKNQSESVPRKRKQGNSICGKRQDHILNKFLDQNIQKIERIKPTIH